MLVVKVNHLDAEAAQTGIARRAHVFGPTVDAEEAPVLAAHVPELRREHHAVAPVAYRAPDEFFVSSDAVHVRRVQKVDAEFQRAMYGRHRLLVVALTVELRHAHAAKAQSRDLQSALAQLSLLHHSPF